MKILLDTCAFLWLATDAPELSDQAKMLFQNTNNPVYLSSVSAWEIVVKHQLGKLPLPSEPEYFISPSYAASMSLKCYRSTTSLSII